MQTCDGCHDGKEEELLFPALEARGVSCAGAATAVMGQEHRQGRECIDAMLLAIGTIQDKVTILNLGTDEYVEVNDSIRCIVDHLGIDPMPDCAHPISIGVGAAQAALPSGEVVGGKPAGERVFEQHLPSGVGVVAGIEVGRGGRKSDLRDQLQRGGVGDH